MRRGRVMGPEVVHIPSPDPCPKRSNSVSLYGLPFAAPSAQLLVLHFFVTA